MITLAIREVRIDRLVLPGNFLELKGSPAAEQAAVAISVHGQLIEPIVDVDMVPVCGLTIIAARARMGSKTVVVKMVEIEPNDNREAIAYAFEHPPETPPPSVHHRSQEIRAMFDAEVAKIVAANPGIAISGGGRRKTAEGLAREALAKALGIRPGSIATCLARTRARVSSAGKPTAPAPPPIDTLGVPVAPAELAEMARVQAITLRAVEAAKLTLRELGRLHESPRVEATREALARAAHNLELLVPTSICPWCKLVPEVRAECLGCCARGYVGKEEVPRPPLLLDRDAPRVSFRGKVVPMADFAPADEPYVPEFDHELPAEMDPRDGGEDPGPGPGPESDGDDWMCEL